MEAPESPELDDAKYVIARLLGRGGMGEVHVGYARGAEGFRRRVAIKRIRTDACTDERFLKMFITEAKLAGRLEHENIVSVLSFEEDEEGGLFLVMEFVDGVDLGRLLRQGPAYQLPVPIALFVAGEILQGLAYAHDLPIGADGTRGLVHRDVSPQNVLLSWSGGVKVSDFGLAKARTATLVSNNSARTKGKPGYMSPEHAGAQELDGRSDLFSVGIILWEMLVGEHLFQRETEAATFKSLLIEAIPTPRLKRPEIPADVEQVTRTLLERDPENRYANAKVALATLKRCADFPKDGRELLSGLLIERFPQWVPQHHGGLATPIAALPPDTQAAADPARLLHPEDGFRAIQKRFKPARSRTGPSMIALMLAVLAVGGMMLATVALTLQLSRSGAVAPGPSASPALPAPAPGGVQSPPAGPLAAPAPLPAPPVPGLDHGAQDGAPALTSRTAPSGPRPGAESASNDASVLAPHGGAARSARPQPAPAQSQRRIIRLNIEARDDH